ncbi:MAG TPA: tetratricopeptide repeat protein [Polyangiaceae bacterium]|nr:tetratricopeptide repeat protein [Polyangiaceae bacterium]
MISHHDTRSTIPAQPAALQQTAAAYLRQALFELERGDVDGAESTLRQALQLTPDFAEALYQLGLIRVHRGDRLGARPILLAALRASERHPPQPALATRIAEQLAKLLSG